MIELTFSKNTDRSYLLKHFQFFFSKICEKLFWQFFQSLVGVLKIFKGTFFSDLFYDIFWQLFVQEFSSPPHYQSWILKKKMLWILYVYKSSKQCYPAIFIFISLLSGFNFQKEELFAYSKRESKTSLYSSKNSRSRCSPLWNWKLNMQAYPGSKIIIIQKKP